MAAVLFDWDGTLIDSWRVHVQAAEVALTECGLPTDADAVRRFLLSDDLPPDDLDPQAFLRAWRLIQPLYAGLHRSIEPYPGVAPLLDAVLAEGYATGVVTSKRRWAVERELERVGWLGQFACSICREDTQRHKPHPEPLLRAQQAFAGQAVAYVGDAPSDIVAAKAAGLRAFGAAWGWHGAQALHDAGADRVLRAPRELLDALAEIGEDRAALP